MARMTFCRLIGVRVPVPGLHALIAIRRMNMRGATDPLSAARKSPSAAWRCPRLARAVDRLPRRAP